MIAKRIIPCLDVHHGVVVKGVSFRELQTAGDPVALASKYVEDGADELALLDISASIEGRETFVDVIRRVASEINIPFTVGGGVRSAEDAYRILANGADKVAVNTAAIQSSHRYLKDSAHSVLCWLSMRGGSMIRGGSGFKYTATAQPGLRGWMP